MFKILQRFWRLIINNITSVQRLNFRFQRLEDINREVQAQLTELYDRSDLSGIRNHLVQVDRNIARLSQQLITIDQRLLVLEIISGSNNSYERTVQQSSIRALENLTAAQASRIRPILDNDMRDIILSMNTGTASGTGTSLARITAQQTLPLVFEPDDNDPRVSQIGPTIRGPFRSDSNDRNLDPNL